MRVKEASAHDDSTSLTTATDPSVATTKMNLEEGSSPTRSEHEQHDARTPHPSNDSTPSKLFVGGLSWQTTTEKLRDYFSAYGTVTDVLIMKDPVTQVRNCVHDGAFSNVQLTGFMFCFPEKPRIRVHHVPGPRQRRQSAAGCQPHPRRQKDRPQVRHAAERWRRQEVHDWCKWPSRGLEFVWIAEHWRSRKDEEDLCWRAQPGDDGR